MARAAGGAAASTQQRGLAATRDFAALVSESKVAATLEARETVLKTSILTLSKHFPSSQQRELAANAIFTPLLLVLHNCAVSPFVEALKTNFAGGTAVSNHRMYTATYTLVNKLVEISDGKKAVRAYMLKTLRDFVLEVIAPEVAGLQESALLTALCQR